MTESDTLRPRTMPEDPTPLSEGEARTLEGIHAILAQRVSAVFSEPLGEALACDVLFIEPTTRDRFIQSLGEPACAYTFMIVPADVPAVLAFSLPLVYRYVYRQPGGLEGDPPEHPHPITDDERYGMSEPAISTLVCVEAAWESYIRILGRNAHLSRDRSSLEAHLPEDAVLHVCLILKSVSFQEPIHLCYPRAIVEKVGSILKGIPGAVEQVLSRVWSDKTRLGSIETLDSRRFIVSRLSVRSAPRDAPGTVVAKQVLPASVESYDPDAPDGSAWWLFNDWAGLQFLTEVMEGEPVSPRFYGGDREGGLFALEDLGSGPRLQDVLYGEDQGLVEATLMRLMTALGRMHALTLGKRDAYHGIRNALGPRRLEPDPEKTIEDRRRTLHELADALNVAVPTEADVELPALNRILDANGPFQAYTHQDLAPGNVVLAGETVRLLDFEHGGYRHALLDGVYSAFSFQLRLPERIYCRMQEVYREQLVIGCPEARDDTAFGRAVVGATLWHLLGSISLSSLEWDVPERIVVHEPRMLAQLNRFSRATEAFGHLEAMGALARDLARALRAHWPEETYRMPLFPAFRE